MVLSSWRGHCESSPGLPSHGRWKAEYQWLRQQRSLLNMSHTVASAIMARVESRRRHHWDLRPASRPADRRVQSEPSLAPRCHIRRRWHGVQPTLARLQVALSTDRRSANKLYIDVRCVFGQRALEADASALEALRLYAT